MSPILNLIWFLFGGLFMAFCWLLAAVIMAITVVGLPWARACLNLASLALWPFGREAVSRDLLYGKEDIGTSGLGVVGNVIWFVLAGAWLALAPIGKAIVSKEVAAEVRKRRAELRVDQLQAAGS